MIKLHEKYITTKKGESIEGVIPFEDFKRLLEYIEYLEDKIELEDAIKNAEGFTPIDDFITELKNEGRVGRVGFSPPYMSTPKAGVKDRVSKVI